jgi:peptidyl-prolyl cis-trans isomerase B (cyclophilin B)
MTPPKRRLFISLPSICRATIAGALVMLAAVGVDAADAATPPAAVERQAQGAAPAQEQPPAAAPQKPADGAPASGDAKPPAGPGGGDGSPAPAEGTGGAAKPAETKPSEAPAKPVVAVFQCESGIFKVELALKQAPRLCANFINLANRGYFNGQQWIDFSPVVRQTGANPGGDPAYTLPREFSKDLFFDKPGRLCFSNDSDDVSKARAKPTRIFVTVKPQDRWNLQYSAIGTITEGLEFVARMTPGERIVRVVIEGDVSAHQARYAKQIAEWNKALDAAGLVEKR